MFTQSLMVSSLFCRGLFVISFVVGLTFACVYAESWRWGALLAPIEVTTNKVRHLTLVRVDYYAVCIVLVLTLVANDLGAF